MRKHQPILQFIFQIPSKPLIHQVLTRSLYQAKSQIFKNLPPKKKKQSLKNKKTQTNKQTKNKQTKNNKLIVQTLVAIKEVNVACVAKTIVNIKKPCTSFSGTPFATSKNVVKFSRRSVLHPIINGGIADNNENENSDFSIGLHHLSYFHSIIYHHIPPQK